MFVPTHEILAEGHEPIAVRLDRDPQGGFAFYLQDSEPSGWTLENLKSAPRFHGEALHAEIRPTRAK